MRRAVALLVSIVGVLASSQTSRAGFAFTFPGGDLVVSSSDSDGRAANVLFHLDNGTLTATVTNTGNAANVPTDVLTGMFFQTNNTQSNLSATNAAIASNSGAVYVDKKGKSWAADVDPLPTNINGEWAAGANKTVNGINFTYGVGASGLGGTFGSGEVIDPTNGAVLDDYFSDSITGNKGVQGGTPPDGVTGGIVSDIGGSPSDDTPSDPNGGIKTRAFVQSSAVFTIKNFSGDLTNITSVWFQYGTSLSEAGIGETSNGGHLNPVPAPPTAILALLGLPGFAAATWARRRRVAVA